MNLLFVLDSIINNSVGYALDPAYMKIKTGEDIKKSTGFYDKGLAYVRIKPCYNLNILKGTFRHEAFGHCFDERINNYAYHFRDPVMKEVIAIHSEREMTTFIDYEGYPHENALGLLVQLEQDVFFNNLCFMTRYGILSGYTKQEKL